MLGRRYPTSSPSGRQQGNRWLRERIGPEPAITLTLLTTKPGPDVAPIHDRLMVVPGRRTGSRGSISLGPKPSYSVRYRPAHWPSSRYDNASGSGGSGVPERHSRAAISLDCVRWGR
jgi:hypothetical protein